MNNVLFGDAIYQYYETVCGGIGAGPGFNGAAAGADAHDQHPHDRPRDPRAALPRAARGIRHPPRLRRRGAVARRRRRRAGASASCARWRRSIVASRRTVAPHGLAGGADGAPGRQWVERADGTHPAACRAATARSARGRRRARRWRRRAAAAGAPPARGMRRRRRSRLAAGLAACLAPAGARLWFGPRLLDWERLARPRSPTSPPPGSAGRSRWTGRVSSPCCRSPMSRRRASPSARATATASRVTARALRAAPRPRRAARRAGSSRARSPWSAPRSACPGRPADLPRFRPPPWLDGARCAGRGLPRARSAARCWRA